MLEIWKNQRSFWIFGKYSSEWADLASAHTPASGREAQQAQAKLIYFLPCVGWCFCAVYQEQHWYLLSPEQRAFSTALDSGSWHTFKLWQDLGEQAEWTISEHGSRPHLPLLSLLLQVWPQQVMVKPVPFVCSSLPVTMTSLPHVPALTLTSHPPPKFHNTQWKFKCCSWCLGITSPPVK